jgi:hypothetical protein
MVAPIHKDGLDAHQIQLTTIMRVFSPISGIFSATDINTADIVKNRSVLIPDVRVDDYIVDAEIGRIGVDHYSGSEFTGEWKNGLPPIEWRRYSMSRHRAFGYTIFNEQALKSPIPNLQQVYEARKMEYTVLRDHDKYTIGAIVQGHMTGKQVARLATDTVPPVTVGAHLISHTGNAADYKWIAEPGETFDNEIQPSFAAIQGMELDNANPLNTLDALTLQFSDNWFDSNTSLHGERYLLITAAYELALLNYLISQGTGTETAFDMLRNGKAGMGEFEKGQAAGYIGTIRGGWKLIKIHPEFLPKVFVDASLVVDPIGYTGKGGVTLKQVAALACYSQSAQTFDYFSKRRQEDGGTRFDGTEYVQDFSYDAWVIEQRSEGIVPLFIPSTPGIYQKTLDSFNFVAAQVSAARAQLGAYNSSDPDSTNYPMSGPETLLSTPEWYHPDYTSTSNLDTDLDVQETGDMAHTNPINPDDNPFDAEEVENQAALNEEYAATILDGATTYADADALDLGENVKVGSKVFNVTDAGTTVAGDDDLWDAIDVGDTSPFGTGPTAGVVERLI